jgi:hypothetical protein
LLQSAEEKIPEQLERANWGQPDMKLRFTMNNENLGPPSELRSVPGAVATG